MDFSDEHIKDKNLILTMKKFEESLYFSNDGQKILSDKGMQNMVSFEGVRTIQRLTLKKFNFNASDKSLESYRRIFNYYYKSPFFYDSVVMNSIVYYRENKCLYYTNPTLNIGDTIPECNIISIDDNKTCTIMSTILSAIKQTTMICAFSGS